MPLRRIDVKALLTRAGINPGLLLIFTTAIGLYIALIPTLSNNLPEDFAGVTIAVGLFALVGVFLFAMSAPKRWPKIDPVALLVLSPGYAALTILVIVVLSLWFK